MRELVTFRRLFAKHLEVDWSIIVVIHRVYFHQWMMPALDRSRTPSGVCRWQVARSEGGDALRRKGGRARMVTGPLHPIPTGNRAELTEGTRCSLVTEPTRSTHADVAAVAAVLGFGGLVPIMRPTILESFPCDAEVDEEPRQAAADHRPDAVPPTRGHGSMMLRGPAPIGTSRFGRPHAVRLSEYGNRRPVPHLAWVGRHGADRSTYGRSRP